MFITSFKMVNVKAAKDALRTEIYKLLNAISREEKKIQSEIVRQKLCKLQLYKAAKTVSIYLSIEKEIDTEPIVRQIFEDGKKCFVPRCQKNGVMEMVELYSMEDWALLPFTKWKIRQPSFEDKRRNAIDIGLDLMIIPGVAFTTYGSRLGHGGGYYDRYLKMICHQQSKPPNLLAVCFKEQIVKDLPTEETDYKMNMVLYA